MFALLFFIADVTLSDTEFFKGSIVEQVGSVKLF
jgi:hypothetical protein